VTCACTPASDEFGGIQRVSSNSSRFGLRASKDLEALNLKVFAQLENGVNWDAGGDTLAGRDTFAGAEGPWGKLRLGKMDTPMKDLGGLTDRFKGTGIQDDGSIALLGGSNNGFSRRQNNSVRYDSPWINGFKGAAQYGLDSEDLKSSAQKKLLSLNGEYAAGPLKAAAAYETHKNFNTPGKTDHAYRLSANYEFGFANVGASFNRMSFDLASGSAERKYATVTAGIPVTAGGVLNLRYSKAGGVSGSAPAGTTIAGADGAALFVGGNSGARQVTLGYEHTVLKGLQAYAYWTRVDNDADANYRFGVNALNVAAADRGARPTGVVAGMMFEF
jgi:predicted porin